VRGQQQQQQQRRRRQQHMWEVSARKRVDVRSPALPKNTTQSPQTPVYAHIPFTPHPHPPTPTPRTPHPTHLSAVGSLQHGQQCVECTAQVGGHL
jgi:sRNA-binding protein